MSEIRLTVVTAHRDDIETSLARPEGVCILHTTHLEVYAKFGELPDLLTLKANFAEPNASSSGAEEVCSS